MTRKCISTALDVAKYVINYARRNGHGYSMTNLKLQKILYFLWIEYYKETQEFLFAEEFYAWQLGPVVQSVYYRYCSYTANPISEQEDVYINESTLGVMDDTLDSLLPISAYDLVQKSHREKGAWYKIYNSLNGCKALIPFEDIINLEANE